MALTLGKVIDVRFSGGDEFHHRPLISNANVLNLTGDHTLTDQDRATHLLITTGSSDITITLPESAINQGREITLIKTDTGTGDIFLAVSGSDTMFPTATFNDNMAVGTTGMTVQWDFAHIAAVSTSNFSAASWVLLENNMGYS